MTHMGHFNLDSVEHLCYNKNCWGELFASLPVGVVEAGMEQACR